MLDSFKGARLGIFIFIGSAIIVLSVFLIGNKDSLFEDTIRVKSYFSQVEGLKTGAPVRLSGYDVGTVTSINIVDEIPARIELLLDIEKDVIKFIRLNSEATIATEGLVGKKIVAITPGSEEYEVIQDGGTLKSKDPVNMGEIFEEARGIVVNLQSVSKDFAEITARVNTGEGTIGKLINDDELYNSTVKVTQTADKSLSSITGRMENIADIIIDLSDEFQTMSSNLDNTISDINNIIARINRGEGALGALIADEAVDDSVKIMISNLVQTTREVLDGTQGFAENMEALKHNWLFKSYFEERGYWDKAEYEKEINRKLEEIRRQNTILEERLKELRKYEETSDSKSE